MGSKDVEWNSFLSSGTSTHGMANPHPQISHMNPGPSCIDANTSVCGKNSFTNSAWQYQQVSFQPIAGVQQGQALTPQQHQWMIAQQKAFEEQKKLYDQFMKQKQFDEQKQRLKEFGTFGVKGNVSADSMIENILGKPESHSKTAPKRDVSTNARHFHHPVAAELKSPPSLPSFPPTHPQCVTFAATPYPVPAAPHKTIMGAPPAPHSHPPSREFSKETTGEKAFNNLAFNPPQSGSIQQQVKQQPLALPPWLSDPKKVPRFYHLCGELVMSTDGRVDTSKAYTLLVQSSLPANLLGVLWEMVNRTQPGCLEMIEFWGLLVLIALVQRGTAFQNSDILGDIQEALYPSINHPTLMGCLQGTATKEDPKQAAPQSSPGESSASQADDEFDDFVSAATAPPLPPSSSGKPSAANATAPLPPLGELGCGHVPTTIPLSSSEMTLTKLGSLQGVNNDKLPTLDSSKDLQSLKRMNLPSLGSSPLHSRQAQPPELDDFDDFQSAVAQPPPTVSKAPATITSQVPSSHIDSIIDKSQSYPTFDSDPQQDKYAVFRELSSLNVEDQDKGDDSFGDFCGSFLVGESACSHPVSNPTSSHFNAFASEEIIRGCDADVPSATSKLDEGWTTDPFGEFEECPKPTPSLEFSSDSGSYVTADASADTSNDADDEFGDFVKPISLVNGKSTLTPVSSGINLAISEIQAETQSVASLELPGLDVTVNLSENQSSLGDLAATLEPSNTKVYPSNLLEHPTKLDFPAAFDHPLKTQTTCNIEKTSSDLTGTSHSAAEDELSKGIKALEMNSEGKQKSDVNGISTIPPISSFSLADKYSIMRTGSTQNELEDPHSESWKKCLRGCKELLEGGLLILNGIPDKQDLFNRVLLTSQMQEYLGNLNEVWRVSKRIRVSCSKMATSSCIQDLLDENDRLWTSILKITAGKFDKVDQFQEEKNDAKEDACSLCLTGGGASLCYGGHSYHPPCANLWLNVVDLTLPTLASTSVALL